MRIFSCLVVLGLVAMKPVAAQATLTADLAVNSQYQWRGVTTTNRPVIQPGMLVSVPLAPITVAFGLWGSIEGGRYDNAARHISQNGGAGVSVAEYDAWVEGTGTIGSLGLTLGVQTYTFPSESGTTSASNTAEIYVKSTMGGPLSPAVAIWHDVRSVSGTYAEASISQHLGPVRLGATTGWNIGQSVGDGGALGYFARRGFTHADLSATTAVTVGHVTFAPTLHVVLGGDDNTRIAAPGRTSRTKVWVGSMLTWSRQFHPSPSLERAPGASEGER